MKRMRKMMALVLAVTTVLAMSSVAAFAASADTATVAKYNASVTVDNVKTGNTLNLYRIAAFNLDEETNAVTYTLAENLPAAYDTIDEIAALSKDGYTFTAGSTSKTAADTLANLIANNELTPLATIQVTAAENKAIKADLPAGWYVATVSGTADTKLIYQNMIINATPIVDSEHNGYKAADPISFEVKHTEDTVTKTVGSEQAESTDKYSVGDVVPFEITTNIPNYPNPSKVATFEISDTPNDLTDIIDATGDNKMTVTVNGTEVARGDSTYTVTQEGDGFKIVFAKDYILAHPAQAVKVEYKATIKSSATIANDGLTADNTAKIKFNPNPNETGTVEPTDTTQLYTYGVDVYKYDGSTGSTKTKLTGAKFVLYKADGETVAGAETAVDAEGYVSWNGLAEGTYKLVETQAPAGYKLDSTPRVITIFADTANKDNRATLDKTETKFFQEDVPNEKGTTLPSTGGMGTTIFYILGALLVVGCGIVLVSKKRTSDK